MRSCLQSSCLSQTIINRSLDSERVVRCSIPSYFGPSLLPCCSFCATSGKNYSSALFTAWDPLKACLHSGAEACWGAFSSELSCRSRYSRSSRSMRSAGRSVLDSSQRWSFGRAPRRSHRLRRPHEVTGGGIFGAAPPPGRIIDLVRLDQAQLPAADNLLQGGGAAEEVALRFVAAFPIENQKLALGLDAFSQNGDVEAVAQRHHRADDRLGRRTRLYLAHEGTIELDLVERKSPKRFERGVAGSKIIERNRHAERPDLTQGVQRASPVLHDGGFCQLQLQPRGGEAGFQQHFMNELRQIGVSDLNRGEVDGDLVGRLPRLRRGAGCSEHPLAQRQDEAILFGQRDELGGRDRADFRVIPAQEGLVSANLAGGDRHLHLVVDLELLILERLPQFVSQHAPRPHRLVHRRLAKADRLVQFRFGAVHGQISVAYQYFRNGRIVGIDGDADAGAGRNLVIIQADRLEERGFEPREKVVEIGMASRTLNGGELIPAQPRDELALEQQAGHASRQNLQHFVARAVS